MKGCIFYYPGGSAATDHAVNALHKAGCRFCQTPGPEVTDLLLPVPFFQVDSLPAILQQLPPGIRIFGGRLPVLQGYSVHDLLNNEVYTAKNAAITAYCAVQLVLERLEVIVQDCPVLVIGWGRIGKCLAKLLQSMGARVTVAARKERDRAMLSALGYGSMHTDAATADGYRIILNTVPATTIDTLPDGCIGIDLASTQVLHGKQVLHATGLPGKLAPEASGELIAQTILDILRQEAVL